MEVLRQRESKWLDMLNNWDKWMAKKHKKVRGIALGLGWELVAWGGRGRGRGRNYVSLEEQGLLQLPVALGVPPTSSEMGTEAVWRVGPSLHLVLAHDLRLMQTVLKSNFKDTLS